MMPKFNDENSIILNNVGYLVAIARNCYCHLYIRTYIRTTSFVHSYKCVCVCLCMCVAPCVAGSSVSELAEICGCLLGCIVKIFEGRVSNTFRVLAGQIWNVLL